MTDSVKLPLLAVRTNKTLEHYTPLTAAQTAALETFYQQLRTPGKFGSASFSINEIDALVNLGLGSDILYLACRGEQGAKGHPVLAKMILAADRTADPSLKGTDNICARDFAAGRSEFDSHGIVAMMDKRISAALKPKAKLLDPNVPATIIPEAAATAAVETPAIADAASATPPARAKFAIGDSIVKNAQAGLTKAKTAIGRPAVASPAAEALVSQRGGNEL